MPCIGDEKFSDFRNGKDFQFVKMSCKPRQINKFVSCLSIALGGTASFGAFCVLKGNERFYSNWLMPVISKYVDPELAHNVCIFMTKHKLIRCRDPLTHEQSARLESNVFNLKFNNPIGVSAGFDKNSQAVPGLNYYGLGFAEVGTVTPKPQEGNPKKRIFRATQDRALINRCGFNNKGIDYVVNSLSKHASFQPMLIGLNLGKNKDTDHISSDYLVGLEKSRDLTAIDYLVINISSPNTPGLRESQNKKNLEKLLDDVLAAMNKMSITKPLLVKIAPDLSDTDLKDIADVITSKRCGKSKVSGVILTNTTITRPNQNTDQVYRETGGLSGPPLKDMSTRIIREFYRLTNGNVPIIGVGGVSSGQDALEKIKAGASLIQLYTSLTYDGPPVVNRIKRELVALLEAEGINSISEAVGLDHKIKR